MSSKSIPFEKFKEDWQRQLMANSTLSPVTLRVGIAISWHMNRKKGGLAFPGMAQLARIARTTPRTVIRATKQLEANGYLRIIRTHQQERRGLNRYVPLLNSSVSSTSSMTTGVSTPSLGSDKALSPTSDQVMSHKPLNRTSERTAILYGRDLASRPPKRYQTKEEKRVAEEGSASLHRSAIPEISPLAQCYQQARERFGEPGASVIAKADRLDSVPPDEIAEALEEAVDVQDLAYALWRP